MPDARHGCFEKSPRDAFRISVLTTLIVSLVSCVSSSRRSDDLGNGGTRTRESCGERGIILIIYRYREGGT